MKISEILKELRLEADLTQKQLAEKLQIGQSTIVGYERGDREATITNLIRYADYFKISLDSIVGRSDDFGNVTVQSSAPALSAEEKELLALFRQMPHNAKVKAKAYCEGLVDAPPSSNRLA